MRATNWTQVVADIDDSIENALQGTSERRAGERKDQNSPGTERHR